MAVRLSLSEADRKASLVDSARLVPDEAHQREADAESLGCNVNEDFRERTRSVERARQFRPILDGSVGSSVGMVEADFGEMIFLLAVELFRRDHACHCRREQRIAILGRDRRVGVFEI